MEASPGIGFDNTQDTTDIALDDIKFINCDKSSGKELVRFDNSNIFF